MRTAKLLRAAISTVCTTAGKLQTTIHELAVECLQHAEKHGDVTLIDALIKGLPKGQRVKTLRAWVIANSPIRWNGEDKVGLLTKKAKTFNDFTIEEGARNPYYDIDEASQPKELTLEALQAIIARLDKRVDKAEEDGMIAEGESVAAMRAYITGLTKVSVPTPVKTEPVETAETEAATA